MNKITEGKDRATSPNKDGVVQMIPTSSAVDLTAEIFEASRLKLTGAGAESRARSSIESRAELRAGAMNEIPRGELGVAPEKLILPAYVARQWADLDATDFARIRSPARRESSVEAIAAHMRSSAEYTNEIRLRSPVLADAGKTVNESLQQLETRRLEVAEENRIKGESAARASARLAVLDAAALASLASLRKDQSAAVVTLLAKSPDLTTQADIAAAREAVKPILKEVRSGSPQERAAVVAEVDAKRPLKRPIADGDLSQSILQRYIVTHEKAGLLDKGKTEFTLRNGDKQGELAFSDSGKSLTTEMQDKSTIRAMIEVANAKNWKEVTVSGTDEFRRAAWLEARVAGIEVRGYEPREADKKMLAELVIPAAKVNTIELNDSVRQRASVDPVVGFSKDRAHSKGAQHVDVDALTPSEKTSLDNSRAFLKSQSFSPEWTNAAVAELEKKVRGERVYIGKVLDHGPAPFKFDEKNDRSYFVKLHTDRGEQVVWGKELAQAMTNKDVGIGQSIVLKNTGKQDVSVVEKIFDSSGHQTGTKEKDAVRNSWTAEPLSLVNERAGRAQSESKPSMQVLDSKAPRAPVPDAINRDNSAQPKLQRDPPRDR